jgi:hypothetical protein
VRSWAIVVVAAAAAIGAGCAGSAQGDGARSAEVYVATIRSVLAELPPPAERDVLPVVYVVSVGEQDIRADVQAEVAEDLNDDAEVRFADRRSEAVLEDDENVPVRDDGVLIALGELVGDDDPVEVTVEVYRSETDSSKRVLTIERRSSRWTVTASSVLASGDA